MRAHRTLVFLDDFDEPDIWGWSCIDCDEFGFGYSSHVRPGRLATAHEKATRPELLEAS